MFGPRAFEPPYSSHSFNLDISAGRCRHGRVRSPRGRPRGGKKMARELIIDGTKIYDGGDCYVIAEIGHNHQGSLEQCMQLFDVAKECGANAVKLQKRDN